MIIEGGDKLLVAHRRLFPDDQPRFFIGRVETYADGMARVTGYSWIREQLRGDLQRSRDHRTKLLALASGTLLVYVLPDDLDLEHLTITHGPDHAYFLTDGKEFQMELTERRQSGV